jgi:outer membrane protein
MKRLCILLIFSLLAITNGFAQFISLQAAIDTALKNSYDIAVLENNREIAGLNNSYAIAGGMPVIGANLSDDLSQLNSRYTDGNASQTNSNSVENVLVAGVKAEMTLYNGKRIVATKQRLAELQSISEVELNSGIQSLLSEVTMRYYEVIRQQKYLDILQKTDDLARQKLEIVQTRLDAGMADGADLLQAQADLNAVTQTIKMQKLTVLNAKADLVSVLNCSIDPATLTVETDIPGDEKFDVTHIPLVLKQNSAYIIADQNIIVKNLQYRETFSGRLPVLKANTSFDYYQKFTLPDEHLFNYGPGAGVTLQVPIYSWNNEKVKTKIAKLNIDNAVLERDNIMSDLQIEAYKLISDYSASLEQIEIQKDNVRLADQLLQLVMQQFQLGHATILDLKAAQESYEQASYSLINLQYKVKLAEISMKRMVMGM